MQDKVLPNRIDYTNVDRSDPVRARDFLDDRSTNDQIQAIKQRLIALLKVQEGDHLLDVGCGTGDDVRALAAFVGSTGNVVGLDKSESLITEALKRPMDWAYRVNSWSAMLISLTSPTILLMAAGRSEYLCGLIDLSKSSKKWSG